MPSPRKAPVRYDEMTREQLVARLQTLEARLGAPSADAAQTLIHDLEVHRIQLEVQNRELRDAHGVLEVARDRFADLFDFAPVVYLGLDLQGCITEANLASTRVFGLERGKLIGKRFTAMAVEQDQRVLRDHVRHCLEARTRVESEATFLGPRNPAMIAQIVSVPELGADGRAIGCKTMIVDVTASKRAQEKLRFLAVASATLGSSFDYRANLAQVARQAVPMLADLCIVDLVDGSDIRRLEVAYGDTMTAARAAVFERIVRHIDDLTPVAKVIRTREALLFPECSPSSLGSAMAGFEHDLVVRASGARSMMVVPMVVRDVAVGAITLIAAESGRKYSDISLSTARDLAAHAALAIDNARLYERAKDAIRAREDVLSFVSHDLRNPLMGIQLTTEMLLRSARGDERRKGWKQLERVRRGVQQMRRMIDDLLDLAGLESGHLRVDTVPHEVKKLFDETSVLFAPLVEEKKIAFRVDVPAKRIDVRCDPNRAVQVLSNLIGNSIKFTPGGGSITVAARITATHALVTVSDTGPGIPPAVRPHIFERFWQADDSSRKGRGLGLFIAKGLVEAQGGAIWVDSPAEGGTTFSFTLPLASAAQRGSVGNGPIVGPG